MSFPSHYSALAQRLLAEDSGGWETHDRAVELQRDGTHYSPALGELKFRRAVADLETQTSPHRCSASEVAIFPGATNAIHAVMSCLLDPGDEVIIPEPMYVGYMPVMRCIDASVKTVPLDAKAGFGLDVATVKAAFTDKTRVLFLNTPGNPTGTIISKSKLRELGDFCYQHNVWLVCDEVYSMFTYDGIHCSARASVDRLDNVVMIDGLSKSHAMSGWRMGWAVAPPGLIERLGAYATATLFGSPQFIQDASAFALENDQAYVINMREEYRERRDHVLGKLDKLPGLACVRPRAGMFIMCDVSGTGLDGRTFARELLEQQRVSVVPGDAFGPSAADFVRIGLAQNRPVLEKACKRIRDFCKTL